MECIYNRLGRQSCLFTGIFRSDYTPPNGLCFDYRCSDEPIMVSFKSYSIELNLSIFFVYRIILVFMITMYLNVFKHFLTLFINKLKVMQQII